MRRVSSSSLTSMSIVPLVASMAMIPLRDGQATFGLLVLGSPDPQRFDATMGTDFLARMAELAPGLTGTTLEGWSRDGELHVATIAGREVLLSVQGVPGTDWLLAMVMYKDVLEAAGDRPVIFRTVDIGADKPLDRMTSQESRHDHALNPALGLRAIRWSLSEPEMFRTLSGFLKGAATVRGLGSVS